MHQINNPESKNNLHKNLAITCPPKGGGVGGAARSAPPRLKHQTPASLQPKPASPLSLAGGLEDNDDLSYQSTLLHMRVVGETGDYHNRIFFKRGLDICQKPYFTLDVKYIKLQILAL